jgi:hypothetical protein
MFGRRRRPLARAAVVGGAGYAIGKRRARAEQEDAYYEDQAPPEQDAGGLGDDAIHELEKLAQLKDKGILTQEEFDEQKAKILQS